MKKKLVTKKLVTIRTAEIKDAPKIRDIYGYYVTNSAATFETEVPTVEDMASRIKNTLEKYPFIVAEINDEVVGYAYAGPLRLRKAYDNSSETSIFLDKDFLKDNIGTELYSRLLIILKAQNILNVYACITDNNIGSIKFHKKHGFKEIGKFSKCGYKLNNFYGVVWMEKFLGEHDKQPREFISFQEYKDS